MDSVHKLETKVENHQTECRQNLSRESHERPKAVSRFPLDSKNGDLLPNEYIVVLKPGNNPEDILHDLNINSHTRKNRPDEKRHLRVFKHALSGFSCVVTPEQKILLESDSRVKFLEQNRILKLDQRELAGKKLTQDDEQPPQVIPPGIIRVGATSSKVAKIDGKDERVNGDLAIVDTGCDKDHPDLNVYRDVTFVERTKSGTDDQGHGTVVGGIAGGLDNGIGTAGVAPGVRLWAVKVVDATGSGSIADLIAGIDYITEHADEIDAANLSLGLKGNSPAMAEAIKKSTEAGVTYAVASGNNHEPTYNWTPANLDYVITASGFAASEGKRRKDAPLTCAYDKANEFCDFADFDPKIQRMPNAPDVPLEISAPASCIYSTAMGGSYESRSGTSFSAPAVAAAAVIYDSLHPDSTPQEKKAAIIKSGKDQTDPEYGFDKDPDNMHEKVLFVGDW